jgi:hypothetical protein
MRRLAAASGEIIRHTHDPDFRATARESVAAAEIPRCAAPRHRPGSRPLVGRRPRVDAPPARGPHHR